MDIQPDVLEFVKVWLGTVVPGTPLEKVTVLTEDDDGRQSPPWVLLEEAGYDRLPGVPFYQPYHMRATTYGRTNREAGAIYRALTDLLHNAGRVFDDNGVGFADAQDETGPTPGPEGRWPARSGVIALFMPDRPITVGS